MNRCRQKAQKASITTRLPTTNSSNMYNQTMTVNLMFLTGSKNHKQHKRVSQLDEYFDDLREDLLNASEAQFALLNDP